MTKKTELVVVGKVGASYGVKGWTRINSFTENKEDIFSYPTWYIQKDGQFQEVKVSEWKFHSDSLVAKLDIIQSLEEAKTYVNSMIYIKVADLPKLDNDYYWVDLIGCQVVNKEGNNLGKVKQILETGANDVLVLQSPADDAHNIKERLVPFIPEQFILEVDVAAKKILVDWDPEF